MQRFPCFLPYRHRLVQRLVSPQVVTLALEGDLDTVRILARIVIDPRMAGTVIAPELRGSQHLNTGTVHVLHLLYTALFPLTAAACRFSARQILRFHRLFLPHASHAHTHVVRPSLLGPGYSGFSEPKTRPCRSRRRLFTDAPLIARLPQASLGLWKDIGTDRRSASVRRQTAPSPLPPVSLARDTESVSYPTCTCSRRDAKALQIDRLSS